VLLRYASFPAYIAVVGEDRLLEWIQVALFVAAGVFSARAALECALQLGYAMSAGVAVVALLLFFAAGEEIAWGQRLLGFETPTEWRSRNVQGETTVHNVSVLRWGFHSLTLALGIYGTAAPLLQAYAGNRRRRLPEKLVPPLFLTSYFLVVAGGMTLYLSQIFVGDVMIIKFSEFWETCLAVAIAWHLYLVTHGRPLRGSEELM
jgi:hypothetical protein